MPETDRGMNRRGGLVRGKSTPVSPREDGDGDGWALKESSSSLAVRLGTAAARRRQLAASCLLLCCCAHKKENGKNKS